MKFPKEVGNIKYLSKGKRSLVYTGMYKKTKIAIKIKHPDSEAKGRIKNEAKFLKIANKYKIGPKLLKYGNNYIVYKFVKGILLPEYLKKESKKNKIKVIKKILKQAYVLDKLKINKLEFTKPLKHIFIDKNKVTIIDFERSYKTKRPKNVTQFCQYLQRQKLMKHDKVILKKYKENQTEKNFKELLKLLT